jgi:hypothetical protein
MATNLSLACSLNNLPSQQNINILTCQKEVMCVENTDPINPKFVTQFNQNTFLFKAGSCVFVAYVAVTCEKLRYCPFTILKLTSFVIGKKIA